MTSIWMFRKSSIGKVDRSAKFQMSRSVFEDILRGKEKSIQKKNIAGADEALMKLQSHRLLDISDDREESGSGVWSNAWLLGLHHG